jgi:acyl CoA:acetate/3-ketoacid CoA transferase beta subunit
VITQLGVYDFHEATKCMRLLVLHPGVTVQQVKEASEFEILIPDDIPVSPEPTPEQLRILREIDPRGMVISK